MAKLEQTVSGDFYELLRKIENGIQNSSMSASLEEFSDLKVELPDAVFVFSNDIVMLEIIG